MKNKTVYIVQGVIPYEGEDILSVWENKDDADKESQLLYGKGGYQSIIVTPFVIQ